MHREALALWRQMDDTAGIATALQSLGEVAAAREDFEAVARLLGASEAFRERVGAAIARCDRTGYERAVAAADEGLGRQAFEMAWSAGGRFELPELIEMADRPSPAQAER